MKRKKFSVLAMLIAIVISFNTVGNAYAYNCGLERKVICVEVDGVKYTVSSYEVNGEPCVEVRTDESKDYYTYKMKDESIEYQTHTYNNRLFGKNYSTKSEIIDTSEYVEDTSMAQSQAVSYGSKVKIKYGDVWYQVGSEGSKTYLKIGWEASYRIRTDNLASAKETKCENYQKAIRNANKCYNKALAAVGGSSACLAIIVGLVVANVTFPPTVIVTIVVAALGGSGGMVAAANYAIDAEDYRKEAEDLYIVIRTYGTKL